MQFFNHRRVLQLGNPTGDQVQATGVAHATPTLIYRSFARFAPTSGRGGSKGRIRAVAYDPEFWRDTPVSAQVAPVAYMRRFAVLARRHGYLTWRLHGI